MSEKPKRRRGAPIGNFNALKHGRRSPRICAVRLAEWRAEEARERKKFEAWMAPRREADRAQHARLIRELEQLRRERALIDPDGGWGPVTS